MSAITSQTFHQPAALSIPRGARLAADVFVSGLRFLRHWLAVAPAARRTRDADAVRALARRCQDSDPGFAADLYAAVARHDNSAD